MRRTAANVLAGLGWLMVWYFAILAFILLMGIARSPIWVRVLTAFGLIAGGALVMGSNYLRERGALWRAAQARGRAGTSRRR